MKKMLLIFGMMFILFSSQNVIAATTTIDNSWVSTIIGQIQPNNGINGGWRGFGQTFTLEGTEDFQLDNITIWLYNASPTATELNWAIYTGNKIDNTQLVTSFDLSMSAYVYSPWPYTITTGGVILNPNQEYSFWITTTSGVANLGTNAGYDGGYLRGEANLSGAFYDPPNEDLAFVMNLSSLSVPIPSTMILLVIGLIGITGIKRKEG